MRILFIGDVVGRPGRTMLKRHLKRIREEHRIDLVVANTENASHGNGITLKNARELFDLGIDMMTGGNHSWDKRDIIPIMEEAPILRPLNYPQAAPGRGIGTLECAAGRIAVVNLMGHFMMPMVDNPFTMITSHIKALKEAGYHEIMIDFHAEVTSEKRALLLMLRGEVSAIFGTHTHIGTDDLSIDRGTCYVTDVGLTGCRDNVIGVREKEPLERFLVGFSGRFDVPTKCRTILQGIVFETKEGRCTHAYKIKAYDANTPFIAQEAFVEE